MSEEPKLKVGGLAFDLVPPRSIAEAWAGADAGHGEPPATSGSSTDAGAQPQAMTRVTNSGSQEASNG